MSTVVCAGLCVCDIIVSGVSRDIFSRDTMMLGSMSVLPGGDAFNVATGLARLGTPSGLAGCVGDDPNGDFLRRKLLEGGVQDFLVTDPALATAVSLVLTDDKGERHFLYHPGANDAFSSAHILDRALCDARHLHVSGALLLKTLDGQLADLMQAARDKGISTSMDVAHDPSGQWFDKLQGVLPHVDVFLPSLEEARNLTGEEDPERIADFLLSRGVRVLVLKQGARGCYATDGRDTHVIPAFDCVPVVDTVGCGDAFCAGFLHHWLNSGDLYRSALFASAAAGHCLGHAGAGIRCDAAELQGLLHRQKDIWSRERRRA